jgi:hypothetical protein
MVMVATRFNMRVHYVTMKKTFVRSIFVEFVLSKAINLGQNVLQQPNVRNLELARVAKICPLFLPYFFMSGGYGCTQNTN